jgi:hypothetical protein
MLRLIESVLLLYFVPLIFDILLLDLLVRHTPWSVVVKALRY